jgi:hypothetical protein
MTLVKRTKLVSTIVRKYREQGKTEQEALALAEKAVDTIFGESDFTLSDATVVKASKLASVLQARMN